MSATLEQRDFVLLSLEARNRGFKSTLAFRRLRVGGEPYRTQAEAAAILGLSTRDYSALESGRKTLSESDWERAFAALEGLGR